MKKIYLVRHGESEWNILKKFKVKRYTTLTEKGIEQARIIGERLIKENIEIIYSSDLSRAL